MNKKQAVLFFLVFGGLACFNLMMHDKGGTIAMLAVIILGLLFLLFPTAHPSSETERLLSDEEETTDNGEEPGKKALTYYGNELNFSDHELTTVLIKHLPFFKMLNTEQKEKFLQRLNIFIDEKIYYIHDESGFKEMPILISATAVQLSFGLEKYLLPNFNCIHIYPEEFIGVHPSIRLLEGNVPGHSINLSWKHFLQGFLFPYDGQNVGLHEFAHAYYYQYFETGESVDKTFVASFPDFNNNSSQVLKQEQSPGYNLYSEYGLSNEQEFWAESVELFFEKPIQLKSAYPVLYDALKRLWKQDPAENRCET